MDEVVLHRCPMPTNWLCRCGTAERALRRRGIEHRTVRVALLASARDNVLELSGQRHVPVLTIAGEIICDSRRIVEHLDYLKGAPERRGLST